MLLVILLGQVNQNLRLSWAKKERGVFPLMSVLTNPLTLQLHPSLRMWRILGKTRCFSTKSCSEAIKLHPVCKKRMHGSSL